jgi:hypothetical protein
MNKKNYGTIPYYDFLPNQRQVCTILILSIICIFFIVPRIKTAAHQNNYNLNTEQTNNTSIFQYIPAVCGGTTTVSACAASMVLNAASGQSNYLWSTTETTQSITVNSSGTYWWETIDMANNKAVNGDFSAGNNNVGSSYTYVATPPCHCGSVLGPEGYYSITTDPNFTHTAFQTMGDHTTGTGNMMVVNGATSAATIWSQNISVTPGTDYIFSVWFTSVTPTNPGKLKFSIGNFQLNNAAIVLSQTVGLWQNFTVRWTAPAGTNSANIAIVNQNTTANGNDFALDDIVFAPVCRNSIVVNLYPNPPKPSILPK